MIRLLIVDDEELACENLRDKILTCNFQAEIKTKCSPLEGLGEILEWEPNIVFLDIAMPGLSGFDLIAHVPDSKRQFALIFCTAYGDKAIEAFAAAAIDYLVKPVELQRLNQSLEKAKKALNGSWIKTYSEIEKTRFLEKLSVKTRRGIDIIDTKRVLFLKSESHETVLIEEGGSEAICDLSLSDLEMKLDPEKFMRIHRSVIVNLERVDSYLNDESVATVLDHKLPVAKRTRSEFKKRIKR